ncbi:dioxygenase family protein [Brachybacterium alimentarium]|uniref:dioxygenase family protein n=1 Tax=Brachybacterium alimentarium TaxID=47845 RepID=UPI000DF2F7AC|nr:3,4-dioxygenase subunit beta [Brachybacterium alimentarium]RCS62660.1 3,4-dioxygenase subunit beta [Brachybacterium alimentarium]RCS78744.1 3,4-dioxygenase subunit beta [Brachybacterium alimentarium]RCS87788.1 3,4-dioxygenase subunit beta [Brachybacterium alimentarium]RCS88062.1 3,4-dioxygenase subunit beta [Brachybacterium alimentarium]
MPRPDLHRTDLHRTDLHRTDQHPTDPHDTRRRAFPAASEGDDSPHAANRSSTWHGRPLDRPGEDVEDQGLAFDLGTLVTRRRTFGALGTGAAAMVLAACGTGSEDSASGGTTSASDGGGDTASSGEEMPTETAGPYPGDGSNGADVLEISGVERSDITSSIDTDTTAEGTPITLTMTVTDLAEDGAAMTGAAVYVWHCDAEGEYSMYGDGLEDETYLRGVQVVGDDGTVTFTSIFPGCYSGRWPHIHFEVFPDIDSITDAGNAVLTSQLALPEDVSTDVYSSSLYDGSAQNLDAITLESDNVFSDGWDLQLATVTGDVDAGYQVSIDVPIDTSTEQEAPEQPGGEGPGGPGASDGGGAPPAGGAGEPPEGAPDMPSDGGSDQG